MPFPLSSEQEMIRLMVRDFARNELEPNAHNWDQQEIFPQDVVRKMGALGLFGMMVPQELGGTQAGTVSYSLCLHGSHHVRHQPLL